MRFVLTPFIYFVLGYVGLLSLVIFSAQSCARDSSELLCAVMLWVLK
jgi:hypothetical protein